MPFVKQVVDSMRYYATVSVEINREIITQQKDRSECKTLRELYCEAKVQVEFSKSTL